MVNFFNFDQINFFLKTIQKWSKSLWALYKVIFRVI